jgi:hypothetical protein
MDEENVVYIHNGILSNSKEKWNYVICRKMNGTRDCFNWNKSGKFHVFLIWI